MNPWSMAPGRRSGIAAPMRPRVAARRATHRIAPTLAPPLVLALAMLLAFAGSAPIAVGAEPKDEAGGAAADADGAALIQPAFQFHSTVETKNKKGKVDSKEVFLWIPPTAERLRGAILCGETLMERDFVLDPRIRAVCAREKLALVYAKTGLRSFDIEALLKDLGAKSGYQELAVAPIMFVGHSAGGPQARHVAAEHPTRCFALLQYRGGAPSGEPVVAPGVFCLSIFGQFDEYWGTMRNQDGSESWQRALPWVKDYRGKNPDNLATFLVEPGAGHFAWSDRNAVYVAKFIEKASRARIPESWPVDATEPVELLPVDAMAGWVTPLDTIRKGGTTASPAKDYDGDLAATNWHPDQEMAERTIAYHVAIDGKKDQFLKWEDPHWVDAGARFFFTDVKWVDDGQTFEVHPVFNDKVSGQHNGQGPKWLNAGEAVGNGGTPIKVRPIKGPLKAVGPNKLRIQMDALSGGSPAKATFLAYAEGNKEYRLTEIPGMLSRGFKGFNKGAKQEIAFAPLTDLPADADPVPLRATSSAELTVEFYVAYGPAFIQDGTLRVAGIPPRARFPIELKVVAWQFGRGIDPMVKTAPPVARTLKVLQAKGK